jgi:NAD(P)-dependent dehydrogenase (short-subunit alcohol dehydrogenase family)
MAIALITGASSGVGFSLTCHLLAKGWEVIALIRSELPAADIIRKSLHNGTLRVYKTDLGDFRVLQQSLALVRKNESSIDVLFNNAGVGLPALTYSRQHRDMHYEVNAVVPYIVLTELKPLLLRGTERVVINTSSNALLTVKMFDPDNLSRPNHFRKLFGPYAASKLALSLWTAAIAGELMAEGIQIRSACPGPNKTTMTASNGMPTLLRWLAKIIFKPPIHGAVQLENAYLNFKGQTGVFINKGIVTELKFMNHSEKVLKDIKDIYKAEFQLQPDR